jgi:hypothetical protein
VRGTPVKLPNRWAAGKPRPSYGLTAPVDPPSHSLGNEFVGVGEHQVAGVE